MQRDFVSSGSEIIDSLLNFTAEIDKMTHIERRTLLVDGSRRENDAEHSWHIATMAILFRDFAPEGTDIDRAVKMCVVHDLVEIYAGDTFAYDQNGNKTKEEREKDAAKKLFSQLPAEIGNEINALWVEFDKMETPTAKYAACMDRVQPLLHNVLTFGHSWKEHGVKKEQVLSRVEVVKETIPTLWDWISKNLDAAVKEGFLKP